MRLSDKQKAPDKDIKTNFERMCAQPRIAIDTTSVSRVKGRIEFLWATLQSRFISEMRIRGISTIEEANAYLPEFTADYNRRFAPKPGMET